MCRNREKGSGEGLDPLQPVALHKHGRFGLDSRNLFVLALLPRLLVFPLLGLSATKRVRRQLGLPPL
jgi:hypothetical protein